MCWLCELDTQVSDYFASGQMNASFIVQQNGVFSFARKNVLLRSVWLVVCLTGPHAKLDGWFGAICEWSCARGRWRKCGHPSTTSTTRSADSYTSNTTGSSQSAHLTSQTASAMQTKQKRFLTFLRHSQKPRKRSRRWRKHGTRFNMTFCLC